MAEAEQLEGQVKKPTKGPPRLLEVDVTLRPRDPDRPRSTHPIRLLGLGPLVGGKCPPGHTAGSSRHAASKALSAEP